MLDIVIEPTQSPHQDSQIEAMVEQLEAVDRALGQHLALKASEDRGCARGPKWYRERIASGAATLPCGRPAAQNPSSALNSPFRTSGTRSSSPS